MKAKYDFSFEYNGSIALIRPLTAVALRWAALNLPHESWQEVNGAIASEPRMAADIEEAVRGEGFSCVPW